MKLYGAIEAGGTKMVCMVAGGPDEIIAETRFPTTTPAETIGRMLAFFNEQMKSHQLLALGIGSFGPLDLNPASPTYGYITTTPKPGWQQTDLIGRLKEELKLPVIIDTDVNAAALGEFTWGAGQGKDPFIYYTIGTGIGMGVRANGGLVHGLTHPEGGHMVMKRDPQRDPFEGFCPYHGDCFEGLASGPAMNKRWGQKAETLPLDHPAWALEASYIAQSVSNMVLTLSPQRIVLGGGVMQQEQLFPLVRREVQSMLNGYVQSPVIMEFIDDYIVPPALGNQAGVLGSIALAMQALV
ncbi:MAG: ROK family protein [Anaerolineae bacterium]|nr:ROK family protein [Anaerolineae bacterium]